MQLAISHVTTYTYDEPVPVRAPGAPVDAADVHAPATDLVGRRARRCTSSEVEFADHHNNRVQLVSLAAGEQTTTVRCQGLVETTDTAGVTSATPGVAPLWLYRRSTPLTRPGDGVAGLVAGLDPTHDPVGCLHQLAARVAETVTYQSGWTNAATTAEDAVAAGRGVCQDHAHVFVAAARSLGVPARYASGYLVMEEADQQAMHAWADAWVDDLGWVGFDPSNGISPDERYVSIAVGLDYREAAPISGLRFGDATERLDVSIQIQQ